MQDQMTKVFFARVLKQSNGRDELIHLVPLAKGQFGQCPSIIVSH
jgi:hypothetical protein